MARQECRGGVLIHIGEIAPACFRVPERLVGEAVFRQNLAIALNQRNDVFGGEIRGAAPISVEGDYVGVSSATSIEVLIHVGGTNIVAASAGGRKHDCAWVSRFDCGVGAARQRD